MLPVIVFAVAITSSGITTGPNDPILVPDATLNRGGFYKKLVYMRGLPIVASEKVDDRALRTIVSTFTKMLAKVPDAPIELLVKQGSFYSIIGATEGQTDLPEYAYLRNDPNMDWNKRARGLGGLSASGGEENILELPNDRYHGESIYIHEFAHTLFDYGFSKVDSSLVSKLQKCFDSAIKAGKWKDTYAATNPSEYWAEVRTTLIATVAPFLRTRSITRSALESN